MTETGLNFRSAPAASPQPGLASDAAQNRADSGVATATIPVSAALADAGHSVAAVCDRRSLPAMDDGRDDGHRPTLQADGHRPTLQDDGHRPTLQGELLAKPAKLAGDVTKLRALLSGGHWLKRKQIMLTLDWPERKVPAVAEAMGAEIVRSRTHGFKLTALLKLEELEIAAHAANEVRAQCRRNLGYAIALKRELIKLSARQIAA